MNMIHAQFIDLTSSIPAGIIKKHDSFGWDQMSGEVIFL